MIKDCFSFDAWKSKLLLTRVCLWRGFVRLKQTTNDGESWLIEFLLFFSQHVNWWAWVCFDWNLGWETVVCKQKQHLTNIVPAQGWNEQFGLELYCWFAALWIFESVSFRTKIRMQQIRDTSCMPIGPAKATLLVTTIPKALRVEYLHMNTCGILLSSDAHLPSSSTALSLLSLHGSYGWKTFSYRQQRTFAVVVEVLLLQQETRQR